MRGPRPFRIFLTVILALTPLAQAFWCAWAWRAINAVAWPGPRYVLQGLWVTAVLVVVAAGESHGVDAVRATDARSLGPSNVAGEA